jgi:uncharacterized membrane protein/Mg-chelatase subunit ChlD
MPAFSRPLWLLLLPLAIWLLLRLRRRSFAAASRSKQNFWLAVRILGIVLIVFALAGFQMRSRVRRNQILFVVDSSDSISSQQKQMAIQFLDNAIRRIKSPDQAGMILFGSNAEVERFPSQAHPFERFESQVDGTATNLENALRLADAVMADNYQKNIVIVSDGLENEGDALSLSHALIAKGIRLQSYYLPPLHVPEASVETLRVPPEITLKQPFTLEIVLKSNQQMNAILQVFRNGELFQEGNVALKDTEKTFIRIPQTIAVPGIYHYEVRIQPQEDVQVENNTQQAWISVSGPPRLLLVDENPAEMKLLAETLSRRGFAVDIKQSRFFPLTLQDMLLYQAILIRNVASSEIHSQMPLIEEYVHDFGGGFAMLGGKKSFGPGGYYHTPVEEVLPVRMDLVNKKYLADVAMVIVIDKSGSMSFADRGRQKIDLADEGGSRVATLLKDSDRLGVLAVDSVPKWAFPIRRLGDKKQAIEAITSIRAGGGGIYVYSGLREAYRELQDVKVSVKHVILFADTADCDEKDGPNGESSLSLAQRAFEKYQITTTAIGIGQKGDSDVGFLEQLATISSGRFYFTNDMFTLPEIFAQESAVVQRFYITEETFLPKIVDPGPLLTGMDRLPELHGYVATTAKPSAEVAIISHHEDPVLAYWRHGLGQSLAFTSDPVGEWGKSWFQWNDFERFWAQSARYLARTNEPANFQVSFSSKSHSTTVFVDTLDEEDEEPRAFEGTIVDSSGKQHPLVFTRSSAGRYEANLPLTGPIFGKIFQMKDGNIQEATIVQYSSPVNQEADQTGNGKERLYQLTGKVLDSADRIQLSNKTATAIEPLRNQLLLLAIWLFLFDVAARKLDLRIFQKKKGMPAATTPNAPLEKLKTRKLEIGKQMPVWMEVETTEPQILEREEVTPPASTESSDYIERLKEAKKRRNQ